MIALLPAKATWLLQAAAALGDTVVMKQVQTDHGTFEKVTAVASGLLTIAVMVIAVALVPAAWNFRKTYAKISNLLDKVYNDIAPLVRHVSTIADNVNYITTSVREDVQQVSQTVTEANQRVLQAVDAAEERINQLNALLKVVQEEAESAFVNTASTIRGVKTGLREVFDKEEEADDDDFDESAADGGEKPRPRIRNRD